MKTRDIQPTYASNTYHMPIFMLFEPFPRNLSSSDKWYNRPQGGATQLSSQCGFMLTGPSRWKQNGLILEHCYPILAPGLRNIGLEVNTNKENGVSIIPNPVQAPCLLVAGQKMAGSLGHCMGTDSPPVFLEHMCGHNVLGNVSQCLCGDSIIKTN